MSLLDHPWKRRCRNNDIPNNMVWVVLVSVANFFAVVLSAMPHFIHSNLAPFKLVFEEIVDCEMYSGDDIDAAALWATLLGQPRNTVCENQSAMLPHGGPHISDIQIFKVLIEARRVFSCRWSSAQRWFAKTHHFREAHSSFETVSPKAFVLYQAVVSNKGSLPVRILDVFTAPGVELVVQARGKGCQERGHGRGRSPRRERSIKTWGLLAAADAALSSLQRRSLPHFLIVGTFCPWTRRSPRRPLRSRSTLHHVDWVIYRVMKYIFDDAWNSVICGNHWGRNRERTDDFRIPNRIR